MRSYYTSVPITAIGQILTADLIPVDDAWYAYGCRRRTVVECRCVYKPFAVLDYESGHNSLLPVSFTAWGIASPSRGGVYFSCRQTQLAFCRNVVGLPDLSLVFRKPLGQLHLGTLTVLCVSQPGTACRGLRDALECGRATPAAAIQACQPPASPVTDHSCMNELSQVQKDCPAQLGSSADPQNCEYIHGYSKPICFKVLGYTVKSNWHCAYVHVCLPEAINGKTKSVFCIGESLHLPTSGKSSHTVEARHLETWGQNSG